MVIALAAGGLLVTRSEPAQSISEGGSTRWLRLAIDRGGPKVAAWGRDLQLAPFAFHGWSKGDAA